MYVPGKNDVINSDESYRPGESQTDRVKGEYHYKNGYTQKIYSDAHYVREEDSTVPPRYYTPPEKPQKEPREPKPRREKSRAGSFARTLCLCLVCAVLGGLGGGSYVASRLTERVDALQQGMTELKEQATLAKENGTLASATAAGDAGTIPASTIYDRACRQVVGITTEVALHQLLRHDQFLRRHRHRFHRF